MILTALKWFLREYIKTALWCGAIALVLLAFTISFKLIVGIVLTVVLLASIFLVTE